MLLIPMNAWPNQSRATDNSHQCDNFKKRWWWIIVVSDYKARVVKCTILLFIENNGMLCVVRIGDLKQTIGMADKIE